MTKRKKVHTQRNPKDREAKNVVPIGHWGRGRPVRAAGWTKSTEF